MERLTINNGEGIGVLKQPYQCERCGDLQWSLSDLGNGSPTDRLFEYEEVGCTPKQLLEIDHLYTELAREVMQYRKLGAVEQLREMQESALSGLELANIYMQLEKLKKYEDLEKQNRLLKLPCAVGDTVYIIYFDNDGSFIEESKVEEVSTHRIWTNNKCFDYDCNAALYSRRKPHFIFDRVNTITARSFR